MKNGKDASGSKHKKDHNQILRSRPNPVDSNKNKRYKEIHHEKNRVHLEQGNTHELKTLLLSPPFTQNSSDKVLFFSYFWAQLHDKKRFSHIFERVTLEPYFLYMFESQLSVFNVNHLERYL